MKRAFWVGPAVIIMAFFFFSASGCESMGQRRLSDLLSQMDAANAAKLELKSELASAQFRISTQEGDKTIAMAKAKELGVQLDAMQQLIDQKQKAIISAGDMARKERESNRYTWASILAIVTGGIQVLGNVGKKAVLGGAV
jgi:hypothetical protein